MKAEFVREFPCHRLRLVSIYYLFSMLYVNILFLLFLCNFFYPYEALQGPILGCLCFWRWAFCSRRFIPIATATIAHSRFGIRICYCRHFVDCMVADAFGDGHCVQGDSHQQLPQQEASEHIFSSFDVICQHPLSAILCSFFYSYRALQSLVAYTFGNGHCMQGDSHRQL